MSKPQGMNLTCPYCDDVRLEADGRSSILGWYAQDVLTSHAPFPLVVHHLAAVVILSLPFSVQVQSLNVEMWVGSELRYSVNPSDTDLEGLLVDSQKAQPSADIARIRMLMKFPNLEIAQSCAVQFRANVNGQQVSSNVLEVRQA
jgi:hypothetical protein